MRSLPSLAFSAVALRGAALAAPWRPQDLQLPDPSAGGRSQVFLLGPSHFLPRHLEEARVESERVRPHVRRLGRLSDEGGGVARPSIDSMALDALPIFHRSTWELLAEAQRVYPRTVLLVPNWYFGNRYVESLVEDELFVDLPLEAYNVVREKVNDKDNQVMVRHGLACLHRLAGSFPHLKFIFWCIARRTLIPNRTSSVPWEGQYLQVVSRFRRHTLDVLKYCDRDTFTRRHMKDNNGHPKRQGYDLIFRLLASMDRQTGITGR
ncbi:unnamed protein product [Durusdinium trenchii]